MSAQHSFGEDRSTTGKVANKAIMMNARGLFRENCVYACKTMITMWRKYLRYDLIRDEGGQYSFAHNTHSFREMKLLPII